MALFFIALFGLIFGSFVAAYTFRFVLGLSNFSGRSFCDRCKKQIYWYDNIPLFSYLFLMGKCRFCKKKISSRYPLIEASTSVLFALVYVVSNKCFDLNFVSISQSPICLWRDGNSLFFYIYFYAISLLLIAIFIIDLESFIIPDELTYLLTFIALVGIIIFPGLSVYDNLFAGFAASLFLLTLHLVTNKKGMGLGDVKLAIPLGFLLGVQQSLIWLVLSFVLGAIIGVFLILRKEKKLKSPIPFGPFLVAGFFIVFFFGGIISKIIIPIY